MRWLAVVHQLPERTRLRTPVLRKDPATCARLADTLAGVTGVREVAVRPFTGSILVEHAATLTADALVDTVRAALAIDRVLKPGEEEPLPPEPPRRSSIARQLALAVRELDRDIRRGSEGTVDLGTIATLTFLGAGAADVVTTGQLPLPPWFNLAWWAFRTFMEVERGVIDGEP